MTIYVSMGSGDVSLTRTITASTVEEVQQQVAATVDKLLAMLAAVERVEVTSGV